MNKDRNICCYQRNVDRREAARRGIITKRDHRDIRPGTLIDRPAEQYYRRAAALRETPLCLGAPFGYRSPRAFIATSQFRRDRVLHDAVYSQRTRDRAIEFVGYQAARRIVAKENQFRQSAGRDARSEKRDAHQQRQRRSGGFGC